MAPQLPGRRTAGHTTAGQGAGGAWAFPKIMSHDPSRAARVRHVRAGCGGAVGDAVLVADAGAKTTVEGRRSQVRSAMRAVGVHWTRCDAACAGWAWHRRCHSVLSCMCNDICARSALSQSSVAMRDACVCCDLLRLFAAATLGCGCSKKKTPLPDHHAWRPGSGAVTPAVPGSRCSLRRRRRTAWPGSVPPAARSRAGGVPGPGWQCRHGRRRPHRCRHG